MNRIDEIKERLEHRRDSYIFEEYVELVQIVDDLLSLNERYREALDKIWGEAGTYDEAARIALDALEETK